jgi:hypothetical protein
MNQNSGIRPSLKIAAALCLIAPARLQDMPTSFSGPQSARFSNRGLPFIRRDSEFSAAEREQILARLSARGTGPARPRLVNPRIILERIPAMPDDDEADVAAPPRAKSRVAERCFDNFILGGMVDLESVRAYLESELTNRIDAIDRQSHLTPDQTNKLLLAGKGDIKRLFDQIEDERKQFEVIRTDVRGCQRFLRGLQPLALSVREGPFSGDSLFAKTLRKVLGDEAAVARTPM